MRRFPVSAMALVLLAGCNRTAPVSPPAPGMSVLELKILAEPKSGAPATDSGDSYDYSSAPPDHVDYSSLDNIVVWLEPAKDGKDGSILPEKTIDLNPKESAGELTAVVTVAQPITLRNVGAAPAEFYSVSDENEFDPGVLLPGGTARVAAKAAGLIEILTPSRRDPVARIFSAPSNLVRTAKAGQTIEFRDIQPGRYKAVSWHSRLPGHEASIDLPPNQVLKASVSVSVNGLPEVPTH